MPEVSSESVTSEPSAGGAAGRLVGPGLRLPLLITLVAVATVAIAYYGYYRKQADYFNGRNLRLLSMLTAQIDGRVELYSGFVRKGAASADMVPIWCKPENDGDTIRRLVLPSDRGWSVILQPKAGQTTFSVPLESILRPVFTRSIGATYDVLAIARDDGTVLFSRRQPPNPSTLLQQEEEWIDEEQEEPHAGDPKEAMIQTDASAISAATERQSGSTVVLARLQALSKRKGWHDYEPLKPATLLDSNGQTDVLLGDEKYVLFSQPYIFANAASTLDKKPHRWIVCGLVSASRFRFDVSAVSTTVVLIVVAIVVLALCCWPFLRIALIDARQPLTITDVVLVVMCTIIGAAVITLAVLNAFAYRNMSRIADEQLEEYSATLCRDFADNIARAVDMLAGVERMTRSRAVAIEASHKSETVDITPELLDDDAIRSYPYIHAVMWIDGGGNQIARFDRIGAPLQAVGDRQYFQLAKMEREWSVGNKDYVLEWVRTRSTGEVWAVMAKKAQAPFAVVAVGTELIDITHAVPPPGVQLAVIDESGEVLYHSDVQRIGYENFFTEADHNLNLRSAVVARRAGPVDAKYWGEDQSMYVRPLAGSGWTLVTFRPKRLTRVLNVEGCLLAVVMLLMNALPWFVVYMLVLLIFPGYRAPRLWPDVARTRDYARLSVILVALLLLSCADIYTLAPWSSFWEMLIIPNMAIASTYLVLHRTGAERRYRIAIAVWIALNAVYVAHLAGAVVDPTHFARVYPWVLKSVLILLALGVALLALYLFSPTRRNSAVANGLRELSFTIGYSRLYRLCGVLLLVVGVTVPVAGFFAISRRVESQLLVKYAQLRAAADLEHRIDHVETLNAQKKNSPAVERDVLCRPIQFIFGSSWGLRPLVEEVSCPGSRSLEKSEESSEKTADAITIPPGAAALLPALFEDSLSIRQLFDSRSNDSLWSWQSDHRSLTLARKVRFDLDVSDMVWNDKLSDDARRLEAIVVDSKGPSVDAVTASFYGVMALPISAALIAIFWFASTFIAKRVLLIDINEPDWLVPLPLRPALGDFVFLVRRDLDLGRLTANDAKHGGLPFFDVSFKDLDDKNRWNEALEAVEGSRQGQNVRVTDFEYNINDAATNEKKLRWLERLLALPDRTVIIVSAVSPAYLMTTAQPETSTPPAVVYFDRWRAVLDRFTCIAGEELVRRTKEWSLRQAHPTVSLFWPFEPKDWQTRETAYNTFLDTLSAEIATETAQRRGERRFDAMSDRERVLDEIGERAETHYAGLWASCRGDEKLLLCQIANNGLANAGSRRTLRRLMARGLIRRDPNLRLFSDTFRRYVLKAAKDEDIVSRARAQHGPSTWDSLRVPFFVIIIAFVLLLLATQKDLMATTTALAAALTTGLPVIAKLVGVFTERRMASPDRT